MTTLSIPRTFNANPTPVVVFLKKRAEIKKSRIFFNFLAAIAKNRLSNHNKGTIIGYLGSLYKEQFTRNLIRSSAAFKNQTILIYLFHPDFLYTSA